MSLMGNFYVLVGEWKFKRQIAPQCYYENSVHLTVPLTGSLGPRSSPDWTVRTTVLKVKTVYCSQKLPIDSMHACSVASVLSNSLRPRGLYPPGSSVHGILQARVLEWGAIAFSDGPHYMLSNNVLWDFGGRHHQSAYQREYCSCHS